MSGSVSPSGAKGNSLRLTITVPAGRLLYEKTLLRATFRAVGGEFIAVARSMIRAGGATKKKGASRASAAGTPPVNRTGNLARGLKLRPWRSGEGVTIRDVASTGQAFYALFLEKGAQGGGGKKGNRNQRKRIAGVSVRVSVAGKRILPPHPFMGPALDRVVANGLEERLKAAVIGGIKYERRT